jgi:DNA-binding CsgD family transcriptional regulator
MLVSQGGKVHFLNRSAETLLARRDGLMVRVGRLSAGTNRESVLLRRTIEKVAAGNAKSRFAGEQIILSRPSQQPPILLTLFSIHRSTIGPRDKTGAMVAVLGHDPDCDDHDTLEGFAAAYHLTQSEARLTGLLASGRGLFEAAADLGVTRNTARTHMRHIYSKVGAHRQTDIIRLLAKLGMS